MAITPWPQVLANLTSLNQPETPFSYAVEDDHIVGFWDVAKIQMLGLTGASSYDQEYRIVIRPIEDGIINWTETGTKTEGSVGLGGASASKEWTSGKSKSFSGGITIGLSGTSRGKPTQVAGYSFSTDAIEQPVMAYLEHHDWVKKKGYFSQLFG